MPSDWNGQSALPNLCVCIYVCISQHVEWQMQPSSGMANGALIRNGQWSPNCLFVVMANGALSRSGQWSPNRLFVVLSMCIITYCLLCGHLGMSQRLCSWSTMRGNPFVVCMLVCFICGPLCVDSWFACFCVGLLVCCVWGNVCTYLHASMHV